jgi:hypothetical protein
METPTTKSNTKTYETSKGSMYLIGIPFLTGLAIALFSPTDVLRYGLPQAITQLASFVFPAVRKMSGDYELGQVAKLYFATMWLMIPAIFLYLFKEIKKQAYKVVPKFREKKTFAFLFCCVLSPLAAIALTVVNFESNDMYDFRAVLMFHSRWGMPIWGFVIPGGAAAMCAITVFYVSNARRIFD